MNKRMSAATAFILSISMMAMAGVANAQGNNARGREDDNGSGYGNNAPTRGCKELPSHEQLRQALTAARAQANGGLNLDMWGTIVDRDGVVCAVAFTGADRGDQWPGSRVISAQKASTANAFSLPGLSLSTANLYTATQPGGSLFGLQESNPVATDVAYGGNPGRYGQRNDPMVGGRIGGVNVFGGGLGLYDASGENRRRARRQRRHVVRGPQHRLSHAQPAGTRLRAGRRVKRSAPARQHHLRHRAAESNGIPNPGQMSGISGPNTVANPGGYGHASCHSYTGQGNTVSRGFANALPANR